MKPFEKAKKKEHVVDDEKSSLSQNFKNKEIQGLSRDGGPQSAKTKTNMMNFGNYSKLGKKIGGNTFLIIDFSHRVLNK